jgi:hypothetical protein
MKNENEGATPALHPTLAALLIVSAGCADLAKICRNFSPCSTYQVLAETRGCKASLNLPKVQLILLPQPNESNKSANVVIEEVAEDIDELEDNDYILVSYQDLALFLQFSPFS